MRQTSRAVALLLALESANAATTGQLPVAIGIGGDYTTVFNPSGAGSSVIGTPSNSQQLNNRNAGYTNTPRVFEATGNTPVWGSVTYRFATAADQAAATAATTVSGAQGSGCMQCINGGGVWCSRTYSYLSTSATNLFQYNNGLTAATIMTVVAAANTDLISGDAMDGGSCCDSTGNFNTFVGTKKNASAVAASTFAAHAVNNTASTTTGGTGVVMVPAACTALKSTAYSAASGATEFGVSEIDDGNALRTSWWCSNGLYKKVTVAATTIVINAQQTISAGQNKRLELAQVGCPNPKVACATGASVALLLTGTPRAITMPTTIAGSNGFTTGMKCTWVAFATLAAPQWTMNESAASSGIGLKSSNWQIHAMEYTASATNSFVASNSSLVKQADNTGLQQEADALDAGNLTPLFTMPAAQFATLRTWYGEGAIAIDTMTQQSANWLSPGMAAMTNTANQSLKLLAVRSQLYGNVANVPVSNSAASTTDVAITDLNYGTFNSVAFDLRQMRYFPAKVAQTQHAAGTSAAAAYTTALSSYNTAKTTWDAYVAILEKNAKQDAFAALFSPPKAPTVPPLPNKPWLPNAYSGYTRAPNSDVAAFTVNVLAAPVAAPTASQIWTNLAAAQTLGGWGSFTAATYTYRNGWGKSFGTIGYDGNTASIADVWNPNWQCIVSTTPAIGVSTTSQCSPTYTVTANTKTNTAGNTAANAIKMITAVSLWSTALSATSGAAYVWGTTNNGFGITFTAGAWASGIVPLTAIAAPTAAVAAKSLTGIAGAQALVASSAAALAVAAALY